MDTKGLDRGTSASIETAPRRPVVLVVDDEPGVLRLVKGLLERAGFAVLAATDADAAYLAVKDHDGRIDMLLIDIMLPGTPGLELAPMLIAMRPDMKLLFMGGYPSELVVGMKQAGAPFVQKPFDPRALVERVKSLIG
jgi:two-component system cell cycle sensor histidine kinase/response regulator CckA